MAKRDYVTHHVTTKVQGVVATISNGANGVANHTYLRWSQDGNKFGVLQLTITANDVKIYLTTDDDDIADASANWTDITPAMTGVTNINTSSDIIIDTPLKAGRLRVTNTPNNSTNSFAIRLSSGS